MTNLLKSRWLLLGLLAGLIPVFGVIAVTVAKILAETGVLIPDFHVGYSADDLSEMLTGMGEMGRALYTRVLWLDVLNPAFYALLLVVLLARLGAPAWQRALALLAGALDYAENVALWTAVVRFPEPPPGWGGTISPVKHFVLGLALILLWRAARRS